MIIKLAPYRAHTPGEVVQDGTSFIIQELPKQRLGHACFGGKYFSPS